MAAPQLHPAIGPLVADLARRPAVDRIILFGSRARGDARERSDIDIAVEAPLAGPVAWDDIAEAVDNARTLLRLDLVRLERASASFRAQILHEGVVLFERRSDTPQSA